MLPLYWSFIKTAFHIGKKVLLVFIVFFIIISLFVYFINKDKPKLTSDPIQKNREEIYKMINDPQLNKTQQGKLAIALYRTTACSMLGEACSNNPADGDINFNKSFFGLMANLIALPYQNPPASGVYWVYTSLQNVGFIPKTYAAQGIGFGAISAFSSIWTVFRDVAYTVLVLVIVAIGFMIMFRMKLNPQTVISVENALPRIVISLILITFSFAIVGFLIDLMYVIIAILVSILAPAGGYNVAEYQQKFIQGGPLDLMGWFSGSLGFLNFFFDVPNRLLNLIPQLGVAIKSAVAFLGIFWLFPWVVNTLLRPLDIFKEFFPDKVGLNLGGELSWNLRTFVGEVINFLGKNTGGVIISAWISVAILAPFIVGLLLFIGLMFAVLRITFLLFSAYSKVILNVIIAPLYLLLEAVPGQSAFSNWLKGLIAELIVFPVVIGIIIIGGIIVKNISTGEIIQFPFQAGIDPASFGMIIGLVLLFMTPDLVKVVKQIFVPKPGPLDQGGIGVLFGGVRSGFNVGMGEVQKWSALAYYPGPVRNILQRIAPNLFKETRPPGPST